MEEKKKKKKLTLSVSSKNLIMFHIMCKVDSGKKSVVIEKKPSRRWGEKNFSNLEDNNFNKSKSTG